MNPILMTDIEKIRAEIERLQEIHERNLKKPMERGRIGYAHGVVACCDRILSFIDSLPEGTDNEESNRPKLSDNSLEDEMINYWGRIPEDKDLVDTARHFALWQKKQMMKDAVEGTVHNFSSNVPHPTVLVDAKGFNQGDKVRIVVVKEDER